MTSRVNARRALLRRARQWRIETLAFTPTSPIEQFIPRFERYLDRRQKRDPVLWQAVNEVRTRDLQRDAAHGYEEWKVRVSKQRREMERIRRRGRQAYLRKWWAATP
jgi:hypothetical protein